MRRKLARSIGLFVLAAGIASASTACSSVEEEAASSEGALGLTACPNNLIDMIERDDDWTLFSPNVAGSCFAKEGAAEGAAELESHLSAHPFASLDQRPPFLQNCIRDWQQERETVLDKTQQVAVVSNFYFLFNTLKQNALATLEALATLDLLVDPDGGALPEAAGVRYSHPLLHESGDWVRRLRRDCPAPSDGIEPLVAVSQNVLWNVRKINAAIYAHYEADTGTVEESDRLYKEAEELRKTRDALLRTFAPWLLGDMESLTENVDDLRTMLEQEQKYDLVDEQGNVRPKSEWKLVGDPGHPMIALDRAIRDGLPKQLRKNRDGLRRELDKLMRAAEYLAGRETAGIDEGEYQEIVGNAVPFNLATFHDFYGTEAVSARFLPQVTDLERDLGTFFKTANRPRDKWRDPSKLEIPQRLTQIEVHLNDLPSSPEVEQAKTAAAGLRAQFKDAAQGATSTSELEAAQCRNALRTKRDQRNDLAYEIGLVVAITAATFGATWWLAAARAAVVAGNAARVGLEWAEAARVYQLAARGAQLFARGGVSFETQVRVVWGGLLAGDGYWVTTGVIDSVAACSEKHVTEEMVRYLDTPFDRTRSTCLTPSDAMGRQAVGQFQSCAMTVGINIAATAISAFAIAHGYR